MARLTKTWLVLASLLRIADSFAPPKSFTSPAVKLGLVPPELASVDLIATASQLSPFHDIQLSLSDNLIVKAIQSEDRPFQYAFMLPSMVVISTCCSIGMRSPKLAWSRFVFGSKVQVLGCFSTSARKGRCSHWSYLRSLLANTNIQLQLT